uniref:RING-type domain-containing protein n=1 Tax=Kalanchoe fedtschenkoi TaxID=63787 RepID=A0A7N0RA45_KALFE
MAVQAQYPSNVLFPNRNLQDSNKDTNFNIQAQTTGDACLNQIQSSYMMLFNRSNNNNIASVNNNNSNMRNPRKRGRDASSSLTNAPVDSFPAFPHQQQSHTVDMSHNLQPLPENLLVSTGLKLSFPDQHPQQMNPHAIANHSSPSLSDHINHQMKHHQDEIDQLLFIQGGQLRQALAEKRQRQYRALLTAAEESVLRRLREKQAEVDKAVRRSAELEARAVQLSMEAQVWQAKARAHEATAASLQAQLQQAMISGGRRCGDGAEEGEAEDAESVYVDPDRVVVAQGGSFGPVCKACRRQAASVVLLPCRHLCVCAACDSAVAACPYCFTMKTSSVEAILP